MLTVSSATKETPAMPQNETPHHVLDRANQDFVKDAPCVLEARQAGAVLALVASLRASYRLTASHALAWQRPIRDHTRA